MKKNQLNRLEYLEKFPIRFGFIVLKLMNPNQTKLVQIKKKGSINNKKLLYILSY